MSVPKSSATKGEALLTRRRGDRAALGHDYEGSAQGRPQEGALSRCPDTKWPVRLMQE